MQDPKARFDSVDLFSIACLILIAVSILSYQTSSLVLQFDESRNANNALEIVQNHNWLVPQYGGLPDHWNTKPPLLIWFIALLMRFGLPALVAIRLPPLLATIATITLIYTTLRVALRDRFAGVVGSLLVVSSYLWMGLHGARTGDYDTLESFFMVAYVLSFWRATLTRTVDPLWMTLFGCCLVLGVMSKGIAATLALPGLALYALLTRRVKSLIFDPWFWLVAIAATGLSLAYYLTRETYDAGFLHAVWVNELGGRYLNTNEGHRESVWFYPLLLLSRFPFGMVLLPFAVVGLLRNTVPKRRSLVQISLITGFSVLLVLMKAKTQLKWYPIPLVPLFSVAASLGISTFLSRFRVTALKMRSIGPVLRLQTAIVALLLMGCVGCWYIEKRVTASLHDPSIWSQYYYGQLFSSVESDRSITKLLIVDGGVTNSAHFRNYNPILDFYSKEAARRNIYIRREAPGMVNAAAGTWVGTCDPKARNWLQTTKSVSLRWQNAFCTLNQFTEDVNQRLQ